MIWIVGSRLYAFYQEDSAAQSIAPKEGKFVSIDTEGSKQVYIQVFGPEDAPITNLPISLVETGLNSRSNS
ncbi:MAG: hypothetical protein ABFQ64_11280, partial [Campylobacterota bacterium]